MNHIGIGINIKVEVIDVKWKNMGRLEGFIVDDCPTSLPKCNGSRYDLYAIPSCLLCNSFLFMFVFEENGGL